MQGAMVGGGTMPEACLRRSGWGVAVLAMALLVNTRDLRAGQQAPADATKQRENIEVGSAALAKGDNAGAEAAFRAALAADPSSVPLLNNLAISVGRQNRGEEAIALYQRALGLKPGDAITERNLGVAYFRAHRYTDAGPLLERSAAETHSFQALELAGLNLFAMDRYPEAESFLQQALAVRPDDLEGLNMLGQAYLRTKNYAGATEVFRRIMTTNPGSAEAHVMLATAYDKLFREQEAIAEFEAAERVNPNYPGLHTGMGIIYWRNENYDAAKREFLLELSHTPTDPIANCTLARILRREGKLSEAVPYFEAALAVNPAYVDALRELAQTQLSLHQPVKAIDLLRRTVALQPDDAQVHFLLGSALREAGQLPEAARERSRAAELLAREHNAGTTGTGLPAKP